MTCTLVLLLVVAAAPADPPASPSATEAASTSTTEPALASTTAAASSTTEPASTAEEPQSQTVRARRPARTSADFVVDVDGHAPAGGASAADALRRAPGVFLSQHSGQGKAHQLFLRGFDAEHGQDVEITVGGIPLNEVSNVHGQGYADLTILFPEVVQRFRVQEGPYSPQQGDFAVAGSVDVDLGVNDRGVLVRGSFGNFGLARGVVVWAPEGHDDGTFAGVEVVRGDGFGPARAFLRTSAIAQGVFTVGALQLRALASSSSSRFGSAGVVVLDDLEAGAIDRYGSYDDDQGGAVGRHQALVEVGYDDDAGGRSTLALFGGLRDLRLRANFTGFLFDPVSGDRIEQTNTFFFGGVRAVHHHSFALPLLAAPLKLELGSLARVDDIDQRQQRLAAVGGAPSATEIDAAVREAHLGLWVDAQLRVADALTLRGGLRLESLSVGVDDNLVGGADAPRHKDAFGVHLAPKVSADWATTPWLHVLAAYGNGFRSPQARSLGDGEVSPFTDVHAGEVGVRATHDDDGRTVFGATASTFVSYVALDRIFDHASGSNIFTGPSLRSGVVVLVEAAPLSWLTTRHSGTFVASRVLAENTPVPYAPPVVVRSDIELHHALTHLELDLPFGRSAAADDTDVDNDVDTDVDNDVDSDVDNDVEGRVAIGVSAIGPRPLPFAEVSAPVAFVELQTGLAWRGLELSLEVQNLTNAAFFDGEFVYASRFDPAVDRLVPQHHVTVAAPLSGQLTLSVRL